MYQEESPYRRLGFGTNTALQYSIRPTGEDVRRRDHLVRILRALGKVSGGKQFRRKIDYCMS